MVGIRCVAACLAVSAACSLAMAVGPASTAPATESAEAGRSLWTRPTLTDDWFGFGQVLEEQGVTVGLAVTEVFQTNVHGGLSTHRHSRWQSGRYDLKILLDLEKLLHLPGASVYAQAKGNWTKSIDRASVGDRFGVNTNASGNESIYIKQLYYQQKFLDNKFLLRAGKVDLKGPFECRGCPASFDGSRYAGDETTQFLNAGFDNNRTIPFPAPGLGVVLHATPVEWWYVSAGVADAQADVRETGFNTTFHGRDDFFNIYETGVVPEIPSPSGPLRGVYRAGFWYDPRPKAELDGTGIKHDDVGLYANFDQMVLREAGDEENEQGLAVFARWGMADGDVNLFKQFASVGTQYQGLIPTRDKDVLALAVARGWLSDDADPPVDRETVFELYYNAWLTPWLLLSPDLQYIIDPPGNANATDAFIVGLRLKIKL